MLLEKSGDDLGPVGGNLPDQPDQIVNDRIEPLTLPEPPPETEPAQVVLDKPASADATVAGTTEPAAAMPPPASADAVPTAPISGVAEEAVTAPPQPAVPVPTAPAAAPIATPVPAAPAAAPAPAPAPVAKSAPAPAKVLSGWVVQLASLASKSNAMALQEKLRGLGYTAFVEEIKMPQGVLYRVRVGPELERSNAENVRNRLEQQVQIKGIVTRYP
jgi:cell division septation protein DedD